MMLPVIMCYMLPYMAFYFLHQFTDGVTVLVSNEALPKRDVPLPSLICI